MELNETIKIFLETSGYKIITSNIDNIFKYGILMHTRNCSLCRLDENENCNICKWYSEKEFILFMELYMNGNSENSIEQLIENSRQSELAFFKEGSFSQIDLHDAKIIELVKAVTNLKEFSLQQQSQLLNLFN
jgi:hypothetical protein